MQHLGVNILMSGLAVGATVVGAATGYSVWQDVTTQTAGNQTSDVQHNATDAHTMIATAIHGQAASDRPTIDDHETSPSSLTDTHQEAKSSHLGGDTVTDVPNQIGDLIGQVGKESGSASTKNAFESKVPPPVPITAEVSKAWVLAPEPVTPDSNPSATGVSVTSKGGGGGGGSGRPRLGRFSGGGGGGASGGGGGGGNIPGLSPDLAINAGGTELDGGAQDQANSADPSDPTALSPTKNENEPSSLEASDTTPPVKEQAAAEKPGSEHLPTQLASQGNNSSAPEVIIEPDAAEDPESDSPPAAEKPDDDQEVQNDQTPATKLIQNPSEDFFKQSIYGFTIYDAKAGGDWVDKHDAPWRKLRIVYPNGLWRTPDQSEVDVYQVRSYARRFTEPTLICLNVEHWLKEMDTPEEAERAINKYILLVKTFKAAAPPGTLVGYYSVLPSRNYWAPVTADPKRLAAWKERNRQLERLAAEVDVIFPSIYSFYDDIDKWKIYAKANIEEAKRYNKPVIPFLWPRYHVSNKELGGELIPAEDWSIMLQTTMQMSKRLAIWDWRVDHDTSKGWWPETLTTIEREKNRALGLYD